jgi:hypothetical protein
MFSKRDIIAVTKPCFITTYAILHASLSTMVARKHASNGKRLISAVAAFALVFAQLIGAYAHAAGHDRASGHAACAHLHGHHATAAHDHSPAAPSGGDQGSVDKAQHDQHDEERALHGASCDFLCHGGIAILAGAGFAYADPRPPYTPAVATIAHPSPPPSLERPPRSSVRA